MPLVTSDTIYAVPLSLEEQGLGAWISRRLGLVETQPSQAGLVSWRQFVADLRRPKPTLQIVLAGKYVELQDSYLSVKEALIHAGLAAGWDIEIDWVNSEDLEKGGRRAACWLRTGLWCPVALATAGSKERSWQRVWRASTGCPIWASVWGCR